MILAAGGVKFKSSNYFIFSTLFQNYAKNVLVGAESEKFLMGGDNTNPQVPAARTIVFLIAEPLSFSIVGLF